MAGGKPCCQPARPASASAQAPGPHHPRQTSDTTQIIDIPGGLALIGTDHPILPVDDEAPLRRKRLKPFRLDACAVTNARFEAFVLETGYQSEAERLGDSFVFAGHLSPSAAPSQGVAAAPWWRVIPGACWHSPTGPGSEGTAPPDHPVVHISWNDAQAFAAWAGGRLPSEAEWEHAARGGLGDVPFPWGEDQPNDTDHFPCNIWQGTFPQTDEGKDGYTGTAPARSFAPNGYGLYNLVGNVWEWTSTPFKVRSLKKAAAAAHAGKQGFRISKGGSYLCHASYCFRYRIAARSGTSPDSSTTHQGFRLAYDPS